MREERSGIKVIYCRLNHVETAEEVVSALSAQISGCLFYAQGNNLDQPLCIFADIGRSALDNDLRKLKKLRPVSAFAQLVVEIEQGYVANLICNSADRLTRSAANLAGIISLCAGNGVRVHIADRSASSEILTSLGFELLGRIGQE